MFKRFGNDNPAFRITSFNDRISSYIACIMGTVSGSFCGYLAANKILKPNIENDQIKKRLNSKEFWKSAAVRMYVNYTEYLKSILINELSNSSNGELTKVALNQTIEEIDNLSMIELSRIDAFKVRIEAKPFFDITAC
jgi:hypothetical protein